MNLNELRDKIHENAKSKGFYNHSDWISEQLLPAQQIQFKHAFFAQQIALTHSELGEALEADRKCYTADTDRMYSLIAERRKQIQEMLSDKILVRPHTYFEAKEETEQKTFNDFFEICVKSSVEDELADALIRILDICGYNEIDIEKHVELKMKYNENREYLHGKNY